MSDKLEFDIIVYGASGYTGRLVAEYLSKNYADGSVKWAMGGRSAEKLAVVRDEIGAPNDIPLVATDSSDPVALRAMVKRAKVILTTVGPYQLYGSDLVEACAEMGTDYVDLCGEPVWMYQMINAHDSAAKNSGARIVFSCGFDSIPFDLGVLALQSEAKSRFGEAMPRVKGRVRAMNGTFSGGTAASFTETMKAVGKDPSLQGVLRNPFALSNGFKGPEQPHGMKPMHDPAVDMWVAPFIMASINTKNVHRSNALLSHAYGADFIYDEMMIAGPDEASAMAVAEASASIGKDGPKPGEGPSKAEREAGFYDVLFIGQSENGNEVRLGVKGDKDPGYGSTSKMIAEAAICLVKDCPDTAGGILTPASAMGDALVKRLEKNAGLTFTTES